MHYEKVLSSGMLLTIAATLASQAGAQSPTVRINEILASTTGTDVEYIELIGTSGESLQGLSLIGVEGDNESGAIDFRFDFADTATLGINGFFLVGTASVSAVYAVTPNEIIGTNSLENSSATYALVETSSLVGTSVVGIAVSVIDAVALTDSEAGSTDVFYFDAPVVGPDGSFLPAGARRAADGVDTDTAADWLIADFDLGSANTPVAGEFDAGPPPPPATLTLISAIQGPGSASRMTGAAVTIEGVVVGDFQAGGLGADGTVNGFYVQEQDADADSDPASSEGIFVFDGFSPAQDVVAGDRVRVSGEVSEFFGETQVSAARVEVVESGLPLPSAAQISLPTANVVANADGRLIGDLEAFEGMRVQFVDSLTVGEYFNLDRFGEIRLSQGGRLYQFTQTDAPDVAGYAAHLADVAARTIMLDDGLTVQNPDPIRYPSPGLSTANAVRGGDQVYGLTGVLRFSRGSGGSGDETYRLLPTVEPVFVPVSLRPAAAPTVGGGLTIASFNVLNYFNTLAAGDNLCGPPASGLDCRGANSQTELERQTEKLVTAIHALDADLLGLIELENDYVDGVASSIATLVAAVNARYGDNVYAWVDPGLDYLGTDAIAVGIIYKPDRAHPKPGSQVAWLDDSGLADLGLEGLAPLFDGEATSRVPLAAAFVDAETGGGLTVVVNHFKSKGQSGLEDPLNPNFDALDGQGFWNTRRTDTAYALAQWLDKDPTGSRDPDVIILGDLNAYAMESPVQLLLARDYIDAVTVSPAIASPYSYLFDGQLGTLDYALIASTLAAQLNGAAIWNINADEVDGLDYNLDFGRPFGIFDGSVPWRASDHDPVLIGLDAFAPGDFDGDRRLSILTDLRPLLKSLRAKRGDNRYDASMDLNLDGLIDARDALIWLFHFQQSRSRHQ